MVHEKHYFNHDTGTYDIEKLTVDLDLVKDNIRQGCGKLMDEGTGMLVSFNWSHCKKSWEPPVGGGGGGGGSERGQSFGHAFTCIAMEKEVWLHPTGYGEVIFEREGCCRHLC